MLLVYLASQTLMPRRDNEQKLTYSQLIDETRKGNVSEATFNPNRQSISAESSTRQKVKVNYPSPQSRSSTRRCSRQENVKFDSKGHRHQRLVGAADRVPAVPAADRLLDLPDEPDAGRRLEGDELRQEPREADVPGLAEGDVQGRRRADEAVEELQEIKEFLENPKKFQALGARILKGVLLYGPRHR